MNTKFAICFLMLPLFLAGCLGSTPTPTASPSPSPSINQSGGATPTPSNSQTLGNANEFTGSYATSEAEYALTPAVDTDVLNYIPSPASSPTPQVEVQDKAAVFFPTNLPSTPLPLVILLHGNHSTCGTNTTPIVEDGCQYTFEGSCPAGDIEIPSYHGYDYFASNLASFGYIVVSIDANMGITCGNANTGGGDDGLVLARGRMILRHLALLSSWNKNSGTTPSTLGVDLYNHIDFTQVGLFGHSRGGEGVRAAYNLYQSDPSASTPWKSQIASPVTFKGIFEIGPVDGQSNMTLNANNTAWNVILPGCDGDVDDLEGMRPYDRMLQDTTESPASPKSMFEVWGANHDFYNSYWQSSDSTGCEGTTPLWTLNSSSSANEQETALASVIPFFRAHVGASADPTLAVQFDPSYPLLSEVSAITRVDRTYTATSNNLDTTHMETFSSGSTEGSMGHAFGKSNVTMTIGNVPEHDQSLMAAELVWSSGGADTYFQDNWTATPEGLNVSGDTSLNFRVSRNNSNSNPSTATNFTVQLVFANGNLGTAVDLSTYFSLLGPVGTAGETDESVSNSETLYHETLPTIRIPLSDLGVGSNEVSGVRFTFSGTSTGDIFISNIDLATNPLGSGVKEESEVLSDLGIQHDAVSEAQQSDSVSQGGHIPQNRLGRVVRANDGSGDIVIEIQSDTNFQVRDALPVLRMNGKNVAVGTIARTGDLHSMFFQVKSSVLAAQSDEIKLDVGYRESPHGAVRSVGYVSKSALQQ